MNGHDIARAVASDLSDGCAIIFAAGVAVGVGIVLLVLWIF